MVTMKNAVAPEVDKTYVEQIKADHENKISLLNTGKLSNPSALSLGMQNQHIKGVKTDENDPGSATNVSFVE